MLPSNSSSQVIAWSLLLVWLSICVVFDLRLRQVPAFLTVIPLILAALWQLFQGGWQLDLLALLLILVSDLPQANWRILLACAVTILALSLSSSPGTVYALLVVFAVWALWEIGAMGGADSKIIIALVLFFANGLLFIPIVFVGGIQGLVGLITRRKTIPYTVAITFGMVVWLWMTAYR
jgi:Flp pilus assembly protein protease CpaA